jgi:glycosyltransferase involved in cell wall biosynthesis
METPDENMRHMTGASNKVFEYLAVGIAPLVSDLPEWRRGFIEPGFALACDPSDAQSIAAALRWAADHRGNVRRIVDHGWERLCVDWNYESQFAPVLDAMWARSTGASVKHGVAAREEAGCAS